tara:strand:- start:1530 stop:1832 length:303 start_codon:yes stop_codon:yes gene_type:complete
MTNRGQHLGILLANSALPPLLPIAAFIQTGLERTCGGAARTQDAYSDDPSDRHARPLPVIGLHDHRCGAASREQPFDPARSIFGRPRSAVQTNLTLKLSV